MSGGPAADFHARSLLKDDLASRGLYDPADEHDACGVGLITATDRTPRREIVDLAIHGLKAVAHRGAHVGHGLARDRAQPEVEQEADQQLYVGGDHEPLAREVVAVHDD